MKNVYYLFLSLSLVWVIGSSCAHKTTFQTSTVVPAAEGTVQWKKDANNNYVITIKMVNLAEVERLEPPKKAYVVWMENQEGRPKNLGQINSSHETFTRKLKASFQTVSSFKPTKIYITAEDESNVNFPSTMIVLQSKSIK
jgi:hypothetical protein